MKHGVTDALNAVENVKLIPTIFQDGAGQGNKAVDIAVAAAKKENMEKEYWIDLEMVTKDKVAEYKQRAQ